MCTSPFTSYAPFLFSTSVHLLHDQPHDPSGSGNGTAVGEQGEAVLFEFLVLRQES